MSAAKRLQRLLEADVAAPVAKSWISTEADVSDSTAQSGLLKSDSRAFESQPQQWQPGHFM